MSQVSKKRTAHSGCFKASIVLAGLTQNSTIEGLCRQNNIAVNSYYEWRKRFISAGTIGLERRPSQRSIKNVAVSGAHASKQRTLELVAVFQKFRSDQSQFAGRLTAPEKLKAIELVESAEASKRHALSSIGIASSTYYNWRKMLREKGTLESCVRSPEYRKITEKDDVREQVFAVLHSPPSEFGFNRTTWRMVDLQASIEASGLQVGRHAIRHIIKDAGYCWTKARKVLTSSDPEYRPKLERIQNILAGLGTREGFFSIDEYGPFAVKQREGRKLVAPGMTNTVPQFQKSKGMLIMTAALELSSNQVTHFYSKKKNTDEMIKLLDVLLAKYRDLERFYMSWDAASWHVSKKLQEKILDENSKRSKSGGPIVELAPLPAGAQFLNVIESIFSGMSRAVIHNSNYSTKEEAMIAIDRYFE